MCKYTNRLFVFVLLAILAGVRGAGRRSSEPNYLLDLLGTDMDYDYDLNYDQRQKGSENFRLKMDGFFIGLPAEETSLTDELLDSLNDDILYGFGKSQPQQTSTVKPAANGNGDKETNALIYHVDATLPPAPQTAEKPAPAVIVEIPAPKKDYEARNRADRSGAMNGAGDILTPRTKMHIYNLFSLLRRSRRD